MVSVEDRGAIGAFHQFVVPRLDEGILNERLNLRYSSSQLYRLMISGKSIKKFAILEGKVRLVSWLEYYLRVED